MRAATVPSHLFDNLNRKAIVGLAPMTVLSDVSVVGLFVETLAPSLPHALVGERPPLDEHCVDLVGSVR